MLMSAPRPILSSYDPVCAILAGRTFKTEVRVGSAGSFRILCLKFAFSGDKPPFIHCSEILLCG
jgi:hypothetical protein